jgi:hypothetical protein
MCFCVSHLTLFAGEFKGLSSSESALLFRLFLVILFAVKGEAKQPSMSGAPLFGFVPATKAENHQLYPVRRSQRVLAARTLLPGPNYLASRDHKYSWR